MDLLERAARTRQQAKAIVDDLGLLEKWRRFGRPVLVGAVSFDLAVAPDIDMEVYCPELRIEHGFQVLAECALNPRVMAAQFLNALSSPDSRSQQHGVETPSHRVAVSAMPWGGLLTSIASSRPHRASCSCQRCHTNEIIS